MPVPFIMVAPTGARRTKADHPALPLSIAETLQNATACHAAGADALHLHVRTADGAHSLDARLYLETLAALHDVLPDMPVQITTEAAGVFDVATQLACLRAVKPDWASISLREVARAPELADRLYGTCADNGTKVQHILYGMEDIALLTEWRKTGAVRAEQTDVICVLGRYTQGQISDPRALAPFVDALPQGTSWMVCAFGPQEHACLIEAAKLGGALRVGFENSTQDASGLPHTDNAASVAALRQRLALAVNSARAAHKTDHPS